MFEDLAEVPEVHREAVTELAEEGVFDEVGCEADRLCADEPVTRWQLAVVLIRQLEGTDTEPETSNTDAEFTDVDADMWWSVYVQRLSELELTKGCTENSFCPDKQLTRAQAAHFIADAFGLTTTEIAGFNDIEGSPHTAAINALHAVGVTLGCSSEPLRFCPDEQITLQELASLIARAATAAAKTPEPEPEPEPEPVFEDLAEVPEVHREAVTELAEEGIFDEVGCETNQLCPNQPITRWQLAVVLIRQLDGVDSEPETGDEDTDDEASDTDAEFTDVDADMWWSGYVQRLSELELTRGCNNNANNFCPDQQLTRSQAARLIADAFDLTTTTDTAEFSDIADNPHTAAINALFAAGITKGCNTEPLRFCPDEPITLQQIASMINRVAQLAVGS